MGQKIDIKHYYKYEYFSKVKGIWVTLKKTDCPEMLMKYNYEIRLKEIYRYTK